MFSKCLVQWSVVLCSALLCHFWFKNQDNMAKNKDGDCQMPISGLQNGITQTFFVNGCPTTCGVSRGSKVLLT